MVQTSTRCRELVAELPVHALLLNVRFAGRASRLRSIRYREVCEYDIRDDFLDHQT